MKRKILTIILLLFAFTGAKAQYYNEWIDYSKTYYKFKVGANGIYRIPFTEIQTAGLGNVPAEQFQLWRNGQEIPVYTTISTGLMGAADYIEFYGEVNDGKPDRRLYKDPLNQPDDTWSLETDTAAYFLTVNASGANLRLDALVNDVAGNVLPPEQYFMYTFRQSYKSRLNPGFAAVVGEYVYSASYDPGEGWSSREIFPSSPINETQNLFVFPGGPNATFAIGASGNALNARSYRVNINGTQYIDERMDYFFTSKKQVSIPVGSLGQPGGDKINISNFSNVSTDRMVVSKYELTYPRTFNFGGSSQFAFELPASASGNYLEITNFNAGSTAPILYDLTNGKRYTGNTAVPGMIRFALAASAVQRKLVLLNAESTGIYSVTGLQSKNFVNYGNAANQGDYLIISNSKLFTGPSGNPVDNYRAYRSSSAGGTYNAKVIDIDQLVDQFAYGIKEHPLSIRNFIAYALNGFTRKPRFVLLIGRGILYNDYRNNESFPVTESLSLVPTFGSPGSDNLLASVDYDPIPEVPIGRLAAVNGDEVDNYLQKVKQYEAVNLSAQQTIKDKAWMKNVVHAIGGSDPYLQAVIYGYMNANKAILEDTLFGGKVYSFSKNSSLSVEQLNSTQLEQLFNEGINVLTYFGHSSSNTLEFNIDDPYKYNNKDKYPLFFVNGCNAGNFFVYDTLRKQGGGLTLSETYIFAKERGSIGFIASTHFGIVNYLNIYTNSAYTEISQERYGKSIGEIQQGALARMLTITGQGDYYARIHAEEINVHGDPAVVIYSFSQPDYVIEDPLVKINPTPVSVADNTFELTVKFMNIGRAVNDSVDLLVQRQLPSGALVDLFKGKLPPVNYADSVKLVVPINPLTDKGENKILVSIDGANLIPEKSETNNSVTKSFLIIEDEIRPISPYNYAIVNKSNLTFYASAANPFSSSRNYVIEVDTTELFNSTFKKVQTITSNGGLLQFNPPGLSLTDSTVYYWRTAPVPTPGNPYVWNNSSFVYLPGSTPGYNQSHYYQMKKNTYNRMNLEDDRVYRFISKDAKLKVKTGLAPTYVNDKLRIYIDETQVVSYGCRYSSIQIVVYDSITMKPWDNVKQANGLGRFDSWPPCGNNKRAFEYPYADPVYRKRAIDFLESIPKGYYVSITNLGINSNTSFVSDWLNDTTTLGSGHSLYHTLKNIGFSEIDSFTHNVPFFFFSRKNDFNYPVYEIMGNDVNDYIETEIPVKLRENSGVAASPWFGPALKWNALHWRGTEMEPGNDIVSVDIYGKDFNGVESLLTTIQPSRDTALSFIDPKRYPYLRVSMNNADSLSGTPVQTRYWRINADLPPEGSVAPNLYFKAKDTLDVGEPLLFQVAFKNISQTNFDSIAMQMTITDASNVVRNISIPKLKPLASGDTLIFSYPGDSKSLIGANTLFVNFNPDYAQPEQYLFNNFLFRQFYVRADTYNPTLDVTFDGVHILNRDIVSSKPHVLVKLNDNNRYMLLDDTSLMTVKVKFPNGVTREYKFDNDTLKFTPAQPTGGTKENVASLDFKPVFPLDGDYELTVSGKDKSGNRAGIIEYKVTFSIINKPMISNLLNYPNPFTSSTAFVFTVTGSQVPQNLRIQIMTITGKIVKDITKEELGPIHIGRNITEYKWDGRDQYGQKLANGVYLYRVITNLDGKSMEKYKQEGDNTDKYFKGGYGKMYLMR